jgi:hypothetical protein
LGWLLPDQGDRIDISIPLVGGSLLHPRCFGVDVR